MSAYIVDEETINKIVAGLDSGQHSAYWLSELSEGGYDIRSSEEAREQLGTDMYALNVEAVRQRYPGEADDTLPGIIGPKVYHYRYVLPRPMIATLKALRCWAYQCSEGDVPERPLFKLMQNMIDHLSIEIISELPEYEAADWG